MGSQNELTAEDITSADVVATDTAVERDRERLFVRAKRLCPRVARSVRRLVVSSSRRLVVSPSRSVRAEFAGGFKAAQRFLSSMAQIQVDEETLERLDGLRVEDEEYDEIINELINIYRASEMTLFHAGDEY
uniref:DUF7557 family protein n=1 Tax=Salinigranum halophilum TaxID=2565931 RepID=UPI00191C4A55|nr:hypothetical protein [Salinigranum halophilum]